jgi:hypothetical protein
MGESYGMLIWKRSRELHGLRGIGLCYGLGENVELPLAFGSVAGLRRLRLLRGRRRRSGWGGDHAEERVDGRS